MAAAAAAAAGGAGAAAPSALTVSYTQFRKVYLTIAHAITVIPNKTATVPAYVLNLNMGEPLNKEQAAIAKGKAYYISSAQLCTNHEAKDLVDQCMLSVINFPRKQIGKMMSDCLTTGVQSPEGTYEEKRETTVYMTTSAKVPAGTRVGILAEREIIYKNPRDIIWPDFAILDLRIGTVESCVSCAAIAEDVKQVVLQLDLGPIGVKICVGRIASEVGIDSLLGKQVLVLKNLESAAKVECFGDDKADAVLCTADGGSAVIVPAKPVANGFKLA